VFAAWNARIPRELVPSFALIICGLFCIVKNLPFERNHSHLCRMTATIASASEEKANEFLGGKLDEAYLEQILEIPDGRKCCAPSDIRRTGGDLD
jgi:hypothetical protein